MASVAIQIRGTLYDLQSKSSRQVLLQGEASLQGLEIGGGPIMPPEGGGGGGGGDGIWGPPGPWPTPPIHLPPGGGGQPPGGGGGQPPGIWPGPGPLPHPEHPIVIPVPPGSPNVPPPGSPPVMVGGSQPVQPQTPPPAVIIEYPGVGKVLVPQPTETQQPQQQ